MRAFDNTSGSGEIEFAYQTLHTLQPKSKGEGLGLRLQYTGSLHIQACCYNSPGTLAYNPT